MLLVQNTCKFEFWSTRKQAYHGPYTWKLVWPTSGWNWVMLLESTTFYAHCSLTIYLSGLSNCPTLNRGCRSEAIQFQWV